MKLEVTRQSLAIVGSFGLLHCAVPVAVVYEIVSMITPRVITTRYLILLSNKAQGSLLYAIYKYRQQDIGKVQQVATMTGYAFE